MKKISLDNGHTYLTAKEAMEEIVERDLWDVVAHNMDDEIRKCVHLECLEYNGEEAHDEELFLTRYLELAEYDIVIG